jgi:hypothetical protein
MGPPAPQLQHRVPRLDHHWQAYHSRPLHYDALHFTCWQIHLNMAVGLFQVLVYEGALPPRAGLRQPGPSSHINGHLGDSPTPWLNMKEEPTVERQPRAPAGQGEGIRSAMSWGGSAWRRQARVNRRVGRVRPASSRARPGRHIVVIKRGMSCLSVCASLPQDNHSVGLCNGTGNFT